MSLDWDGLRSPSAEAKTIADYLSSHLPGHGLPRVVGAQLAITDPKTVKMLADAIRALGDQPPTFANVAAALVECGEFELAIEMLLNGAAFVRNRHPREPPTTLSEALDAAPRATNENDLHLRVNDRQSLLDHLEAYALHRDLWFAAAGISPGALSPRSLWLDVGCAFGDLLCDMAALAVRTWDRSADPGADSVGRLVGFDLNPAAVTHAGELIRARGLEKVVSARLGVTDGFPGIRAGTVDRIVITNTVQYLPDPVQTFGAYGTYLKPGGTIASKEMWWGGFRFFVDGVPVPHWDEVLAAYQQFERDHLGEDTWAGRKQAGWFQRAGFTIVRDVAIPIKLFSSLAPAAQRYYNNIIQDVLMDERNTYLSADLRGYIGELFLKGNPKNLLQRPGVHVEDVEYVTIARAPG